MYPALQRPAWPEAYGSVQRLPSDTSFLGPSTYRRSIPKCSSPLAHVVTSPVDTDAAETSMDAITLEEIVDDWLVVYSDESSQSPNDAGSIFKWFPRPTSVKSLPIFGRSEASRTSPDSSLRHSSFSPPSNGPEAELEGTDIPYLEWLTSVSTPTFSRNLMSPNVVLPIAAEETKPRAQGVKPAGADSPFVLPHWTVTPFVRDDGRGDKRVAR